MRPALKLQLVRYIIKIAQTTGDAQLDQLLKELTEDTERTEKGNHPAESETMEEAKGLKGIQYYEDEFKKWPHALKPAKVPYIEEFEMEDLRRPESKPPTLRPGRHPPYEKLSPEALKDIEEWDKT